MMAKQSRSASGRGKPPAIGKRQGLPWLAIGAVSVVLALAVTIGVIVFTTVSYRPSASNRDPSVNISGVYHNADKYRSALHVRSDQRVDYDMYPPVGGPHDGFWAACDGVVYSKPVRDENMVHTLEHGAVWIAYNPNTIATGDLALLTGGLGNDTYRWSKGDGNDRLIELGGNDTIEFTDVNPDEVSIGKTWWGDMQITVKSTGETITVTLGLSSLTSAGWIEQIRFADGTVWDHAQMARRSTLVKSADVAPLAAQPLLDQPPLWQAVSTSGDVNQLVQAMAAFSPETAASGMAGASPLLDRPAQRNALLTSEFA